jgi:transcriptional regulator with XRE-family HTH domain
LCTKSTSIASPLDFPWPMVGFEARQIRKGLGVDQIQMARLLGRSRGSVQNYEAGNTPVPAEIQARYASFAREIERCHREGDEIAPFKRQRGEHSERQPNLTVNRLGSRRPPWSVKLLTWLSGVLP